MKKILICIIGLLVSAEVAAKCTYLGDIRRQTLTINPKILADDTLPVGSVLYTKRFGTGNYKTFSCQKVMGDQYIVDMGADVVPGVTGIQGLPVYESGIDGIGFQVTDLLLSRNGALTPAVADSTVVPYEKSNSNYQGMMVWLIKTKVRIDTSGVQSILPQISFSAGNLNTNPNPMDRLFYTAGFRLGSITYRQTSCNVSVNGPNIIRLETIQKSELMSSAQGNTSKKKDIAINVSCPADIVGKKVNYWFNPRGVTSQEGVVNNMLSGPTAASNVGVIFKIGTNAISFFDISKYAFSKVKQSETINLTADYYRQSNNAADITSGRVKAMLEVIIQEE
jgi:type 1 fimbria pilin